MAGTTTAFGYGPPSRSGKIAFIPPGTSEPCETAYWLWGNLEVPMLPLIALHGGPGAPGRDLKSMAVLWESRRIPVLLYDQIGCGESTHLRKRRGDTDFWTDELFLAELDNLRQYFTIERFFLLGHSCGGMLAAMYALTQPRGLQKLVLASCPASDGLRIEAAKQQRAALPQSMQDSLWRGHDAPGYAKANEELFRRHLCRLPSSPPELQEVMALMEQDDTVSFTLYGSDIVENVGSRRAYNLLPHLHEITEETVPGGVLLTNGHFDMDPDRVMFPFLNLISARVKWVKFSESSHMPHLEEHEEYTRVLGDFLTSP